MRARIALIIIFAIMAGATIVLLTREEVTSDLRSNQLSSGVNGREGEMASGEKTFEESTIGETATPVDDHLAPTDIASDSIPAPATPTPLPTNEPFKSPTPAPPDKLQSISIGRTTADVPIQAHRFGTGSIKIALVGGKDGAEELGNFFREHIEEIPDNISLWIIPSLIPDGGSKNEQINASGIDLYKNVDNGLDLCQDNDWSELEGGPYPFSEPETKAIVEFLDDASAVVLFSSDPKMVTAAGCPPGLSSQTLATKLAIGLDSNEQTGNQPANNLADYLARHGAAVATMPESSLDGSSMQEIVWLLIDTIDEIAAAEASDLGGHFVWLGEDNVGQWSYAEGSFAHPLALARSEELVLLIDAGRVMAINFKQPDLVQTLLAPGDDVEGVRVLEPIDLALEGSSLLVLDRSADVYRYDLSLLSWQLDRYDRPVNSTSAHYYVALSSGENGTTLLETDYHLARRYESDGPDFAWLLPEAHQIDISTFGDDTYVLSRSPGQETGTLLQYRDGGLVDSFEASLPLIRPRQLQATASGVYVLDQAGRRLTVFDSQTGDLVTIYRFEDRRPVNAFWTDSKGERLLLAGNDSLYFIGEPERRRTIAGSEVDEASPTNNLTYMESFNNYLMPIGGSNLTPRDNQMPGAPRHYRYGIHQGLDLYWHNGTTVRTIADGVVVRASVIYTSPSEAQFGAWGAIVEELGYSTVEAQDFYRGMQVWIAHEDAIVSRYAHLSSIDPLIVEGASVIGGQKIGTVGNSGSPVSLLDEHTDAHLHIELWSGDNYVGQFLRPIEAREWFESSLR